MYVDLDTVCGPEGTWSKEGAHGWGTRATAASRCGPRAICIRRQEVIKTRGDKDESNSSY